MTRFRYKAIDAQGRNHQGTLDAPDQAEARTQLWNRGLTPMTLEPAVARRTTGLSEREVTELLDQLLALTRAGSPLPGGLRAASAELESAPLRATFARLADHLDQGRGLDAALLDEAGQFPAHLQGLILAGARTGRLGDVLGEVVQGSNLGHELRGRVRASLAYPSLVLAVVVALSVFICHISSRISSESSADFLFSGFGMPRPTLTMAIAAITSFITQYDIWALPILAVVGGSGWLLWRSFLSPARRRRILESVPLYGPLLRFVALAEFCHLTALLVEADIPLPEALNLAGGSVRDPALADTCRRIAASVADGESLTASLRGWTGLPASLGQLLAWGEDNQELAGALRFAGDMFETRAEAQATFASQVVGAGMLILILWWVGFAIAAIYLPITNTIQLLARLAG